MDDVFETGEVAAVVVEDAGESACYHDGVWGLVEDGERGGFELGVGV